MFGTLVSLDLIDDMRLVVYFDDINIEEVEEEHLYNEAIKRMSKNGISKEIVKSWDVESY